MTSGALLDHLFCCYIRVYVESEIAVFRKENVARGMGKVAVGRDGPVEG